MGSIVWPRKTMLLNALLFWPEVFLGGYVLWGKSAAMFWVYAAIWVGIIVLGSYFVCRRCKYYGMDCPTFGYSYLARMFKKDESKPFSGRACHIHALLQMLVMLVPMLAWIFSLCDVVVFEYGKIDHILTGMYVALGILMMCVHNSTGCNKCDIAECRMSKAARESRHKST